MMDGANPNKQTILVVDDKDSILMLVQMLLSRRGYNVIALGIGDKEDFPKADNVLSHAQLIAGDLPLAVQARIRSCDAIVTDYNYTQGLTGIDFIEQVRKLPGCHNIPVIVNSGLPEQLLSDNTQMQRAEAVGITRDNIFDKDKGSALAGHVQQLLANAPAQHR